MPARVIHFGIDECYRIPVLRDAGYDVSEVKTLPELKTRLTSREQVDAVIVSEVGTRTVEEAASLAREHGVAPLILFQRPNDDLNESQYDAIYWSIVTPGEWLSETAQLIAVCRKTREKSKALRETSEQLRAELSAVVASTLRELTRSRAELKRKFPTPWDEAGKP
jgi:hypothetical protein